MKSFVIIKNLSKTIMYLSAFLLIAQISITQISKLETSADATMPVEVVIKNTNSFAIAGSVIPLGVNIKNISTGLTSGTGVDHVSIFATNTDGTFSPSFNDSGKAAICTAANNIGSGRTFGSWVAKSSCDADGNCSQFTWNQPSSLGKHQLFAVAMGDSTGACDPANIIGWSDTRSTHTINIVAGEYYSGEDLDVSAPSTAITGQPINIHVLTKKREGTRPIHHVSVLLTGGDDHIDYGSITNELICEKANSPAASGMYFHKSIICTDGICDEDISLTLSNPGGHRVIAVAMATADACSAANMITKHIENVIITSGETITAPTDGTTTPTDGSGGTYGTGSATDELSLSRAGRVNSVSGLINKIATVIYEFLGGLAILGIIIGGIQYTTSAGDPKKSETGKKTIIYSVIGIIIAITAFIIEKVALDLINRLI